MKSRIIKIVCGIGLLGCLAGLPAWAQGNAPERRRYPMDDERRQQVEERIREHFASLLRSELALSDEQADVVLPAMQQLEERKRENGRERREIVDALRRGLEEGASDAELADLLQRLERSDEETRLAERAALAGIDGELNVRQQVKLRFFVQHFRSELRDRMGRGPRDRMHRRGPSPDGPGSAGPRPGAR